MRFKVCAEDQPLLVRVEPWGSELTLAAGDHLLLEWSERGDGVQGEFDCRPNELTIHDNTVRFRLWDSAGNELDVCSLAILD